MYGGSGMNLFALPDLRAAMDASGANWWEVPRRELETPSTP